ncbi:hypothetical protein BKA93DRAFT_711167, partial [Sparassis latifolia]
PLPGVPDRERNNPIVNDTLAKYPHLFKVVTPIDVDRFEQLLWDHPNPPFVASVCKGLREGFWPWADTHFGEYAETWNERRSPPQDEKGAQFLRDLRDAEIAADRWSEGFGTELLPGMYCMPVHTIPKPQSDKMRLITDQSAGNFSLNSMISKESYPKTVMDGMATFGRVLR